MAKIIVAAILNQFSTETEFVIDNTGVVESINELNTFIEDNRDDTMDVIFEFYFTTDKSLSFYSPIEMQMDSMQDAIQISYQTSLITLCNKGL